MVVIMPSNEPSPQGTPAAARGSDKSALYIPGSIIIAGLIIGVSIYSALAPKGGAAANQQVAAGAAATVNIKDVQLSGDPYVGNASAPVIAYWSDYQCPFCKKFELETLPDIMKKYVNTGKLKVVFKDYPFLGNDSTTGAEYEHAVWALYPTKFFAWREAMFKAQDQEGDQGFGNETSILKLSATIPGIDAGKLKAEVAANKSAYDKEIAADRDEGSKFGVNGTPGFVVGTTLISGAQPLEQFTSAIDAALK